MALKFRRTLSMEDLVNASDEEMDDLLSNSLREDTNNSHLVNQSQRNTNGHTTPSQYHHNQPVSSEAIRNGMRVGTILAPGIDSPENDDFFLHGPQAPILNLNNADLTPDYDQNHRQSLPNNSSEGTTNLPRSKSVRFQEPEANSAVDPLKKVRNQVTEVTEKMRDNVSRLLDREANLDSLADLSDQVNTPPY